MQQDEDLLNALRTDLAELTALHAPSGAEQPVVTRLRDLFAPLVDVVSVDQGFNARNRGHGERCRAGPPSAFLLGRALGATLADVERWKGHAARASRSATKTA